MVILMEEGSKSKGGGVKVEETVFGKHWQEEGEWKWGDGESKNQDKWENSQSLYL